MRMKSRNDKTFAKHSPGPFGTQEAVITAKEVKRWKMEDRR
jgi:hypothetical protein